MGNVDIFQTRRVCFEKSHYWSRTLANGSVPLSEIAHKNKPSGSFYAEEVNPEQSSMGQSGEVRYSTRNVSISTNDDVYGKLKENDLVSYDHKIWRVVSIQLKKEWRRSQFMRKNTRGTTIIVLKA